MGVNVKVRVGGDAEDLAVWLMLSVVVDFGERVVSMCFEAPIDAWMLSSGF